MRAVIVLGVLGLVACGTASAADDAGRPDAGTPGASLGTFQLTYYWVAAPADYPGGALTTIHQAQGCTALATVTRDFADNAALEGTARLADGRMINVDGACACGYSPCFVVLGPAFPWGAGNHDNPLLPFQSMAVDPQVLAIGTWVYAAALDGLALPDGSHHNGCLRADDVGGGINGKHLDWFVGLKASYKTLDAALGKTAIDLAAAGSRCP